MVQRNYQAILKEIAETERRVAAATKSMNEIMIASHEAIIESKELIARTERQLRRSETVRSTERRACGSGRED